ncbi:hypothetical protein AVEN_51144-1 [Araneus ventricosus]|uniref:Uncharacterized protein n=1 Tax=Araneus ventricosus TaxID=182803 RepID=A0A4Y2IB26_ARAVE|nr:hypothetical protein AVEN_51144-1 [Araneus ventricosus]
MESNIPRVGRAGDPFDGWYILSPCIKLVSQPWLVCLRGSARVSGIGVRWSTFRDDSEVWSLLAPQVPGGIRADTLTPNVYNVSPFVVDKALSASVEVTTRKLLVRLPFVEVSSKGKQIIKLNCSLIFHFCPTPWNAEYAKGGMFEKDVDSVTSPPVDLILTSNSYPSSPLPLYSPSGLLHVQVHIRTLLHLDLAFVALTVTNVGILELEVITSSRSLYADSASTQRLMRYLFQGRLGRFQTAAVITETMVVSNDIEAIKTSYDQSVLLMSQLKSLPSEEISNHGGMVTGS